MKVTKMTFLPFFTFLLFKNIFLLFVVHNCRNEAIDITKNDFFLYKHFLICNPKLCINQAIKVTKITFLIFECFYFYL